MSERINTLWVEKYRPKTVQECILAPALKTFFQGIVDKGDVQSLILSGTAGTGKTTVAKAICNELGLDYIMINGSKDAGIDVLRNQIQQFASSISLASGKVKVVIMDEADYLSANVQAALRGFIEEYSSNCRFILTCNFKNRLIDPLHSRCTVVEFKSSKKDIAGLAKDFWERLMFILDSESIKYEKKVIAQLVAKFAPDWRRAINECQRYTINGSIESNILSVFSDESLSNLMKFLKTKDFKGMRKWVVDNMDSESTAIFRSIYDNMVDYMESSSVPQAVLILADYQYKAGFVADQELNTVACMTELMANIQYKK